MIWILKLTIEMVIKFYMNFFNNFKIYRQNTFITRLLKENKIRNIRIKILLSFLSTFTIYHISYNIHLKKWILNKFKKIISNTYI
jgi:hypothetical protein